MTSNAAQVVQACQDMAKLSKTFAFLSKQVIDNNSAKGLDWNSQDVEELKALGTTQDEVKEVIFGALSAYQDYWGIHGVTLEKMAPPIV